MPRHMLAVLAFCVGGCLVDSVRSTSYDPEGIDARSCASLCGASMSTAYGSVSQSSGEKYTWSPRGGVVMFMGTQEDVAPRITLGGYTRMRESEAQRLEIGIDLTPQVGGDEENLYATVMGDYVLFVGDGTLSLKAGGGAGIEWRAGDTYSLLIVEVGVGLWIPVSGDNAFVSNAMVQVPLGESNPSSMLAVTAGYEF